MNRLNGKIWFLITVLFAIAVTVLTLSHIVTRPDHVLIDIGDDGAKNNFTYLYHSMYGKGYWFDGMNYPYGEHIVYTDGMPLLSVFFAGINNVSAGTALTVLWLLIGLSYVLSIVFLYRTLLYFKVPPFLSMFFAGLIGIFTPQLFCLSGHYALSFCCVVPMLFYWTIQYHRQPHWRYCAYFFIMGCITAFLHPYYAGMMLIWMMAYAAGYFIFIPGPWVARAKHVLPPFVSALGVLVLIAVVMKLTDPVKDRPATPFTTFETCTMKKQIVTSIHSPIWQFVKMVTGFKKIADGGEGYVYLGIAVVIIVCISVFRIARDRYKKRKQEWVGEAIGFSPVWLFMAFSVLLFSMGYPFIFHMKWLFNYLSFFKQFRALGRFSWIFYYIITVYSVVIVYSWYTRLLARRRAAAAYSVLLGTILLWSFEASGYIQYTRLKAKMAVYYYDMMFSQNEQNWESFLQDHKMDKNDFQALLLLPFFHVGTEKWWLDQDWVLTMGTKAGLQLHLPIIDVMLSRSSWSQAAKQVKIAAGPFVHKPILDEIKSNKPFLLLHLELDTLTDDQKYLLSASDYIGHYSQCYVYACYPERIRANDRKFSDSINRMLPFVKQGDTCVENKGAWYVDHFDSKTAGYKLFGTGAMPPTHREDTVIAKWPVKPRGDSQLYEFSCWFLVTDKDYSSPYITLEMINTRGKIDTARDALAKQSVDNFGMWFRASRSLYIHNNITTIRLRLMNIPYPAYFSMDEMMLRPSDALIISKAADGSVMVNNHLFKTEK